MATVLFEKLKAKEEENQTPKATMSTASEATTKHILRVLDIKLEKSDEEDLLKYSNNTVFESFDWRGRNEAQGTPDAVVHVQKQLTKVNVPFGREGYRMEDVHTRKTVLNISDKKFELSGGTDAVIVPYKTPLSCIEGEISVLFELKPVSVDGVSSLASSLPQAQLETLAARCLSDQPAIMCVLTDLWSYAVVYEFVTEANDCYMKESEVSLGVMYHMVAAFLQRKAKPNARYRPNENSSDPLELGVIKFKKSKLSNDMGLAMEHFYEMIDDDMMTSTPVERRFLMAQLFSSLGANIAPSLAFDSHKSFDDNYSYLYT